MKVAYLTAGAAGMYCGSCMRDNTAVAALRARGRDVHLVPVYTPIRTDETDVSEHRIFYGGINVYLQQKSAFFRHTPWLIDRLLDSPALLRGVPRWSGKTSPEDIGKLTLSILRGEEGAQRKELAKLIRWLDKTGAELVHLPNAMFVGAARQIKKTLGIPVVCTLTGEDVFLEKLSEGYQQEAFGLIAERGRDVDGYIAVSGYYASYAGDHFSIPADRLHVVPLGIKVDDTGPQADPPDATFTIGYLARICPEKGLALLCEAFHLLRVDGRACRLVSAGYLGESDKPYLDGIIEHMAEMGHGEDFEYRGEVDRGGKRDFLHSLHVFSVPTVHRESKGLFVLEALASGVPVVQPRHGAFPETLEATGGGLLVEPDDPRTLADGIAELMDDPARRTQLGCQGRAAVLESFTDQVMAERIWAVFERYGPGGTSRC